MRSDTQTRPAPGAANLDPAEVERFARLSSEWWDPDGKLRPLHRQGPARLGFVRDALVRHFDLAMPRLKPLAGLAVLDVGCGGGLISEPLARLGATVTGIEETAVRALVKLEQVLPSHLRRRVLALQTSTMRLTWDGGGGGADLADPQDLTVIAAACRDNERLRFKVARAFSKRVREILEEMFLTSLARRPTASELEVALRAVEQDRVKGTEDVLWALLNGVEFILNH